MAVRATWEAIQEILEGSQRRVAQIDDRAAARVLAAYRRAIRETEADIRRLLPEGSPAGLAFHGEILHRFRSRERLLADTTTSAVRLGWVEAREEGLRSADAERDRMSEQFPSLRRLRFVLADEAALEYGLNRALADVSRFPVFVREGAADALLTGALRGEGVPELTRRLVPVFEGNRARAELTSRYAVIRAHNEERSAHYEEVRDDLAAFGRVLRRIWMTSIDDRACPYCLALHGELADRADLFNVERTFSGGFLPAYPEPRRLTGPPRHPRCRCSVAPWVEGWEKIMGDSPTKMQRRARAWARKAGILA